jgi:hypothetical protein
MIGYFCNPSTQEAEVNLFCIQALVVHTGNPSYSGGIDLEDGGLKPD